MTIDSAWIGLGALALFVAWLAWTVLRARRRADAPAAVEGASAAPPAAAPVEVADAVVAPAIAPARSLASPVAAARAAPVAAPTVAPAVASIAVPTVPPAPTAPAIAPPAAAAVTPSATPVPSPRPARPPPQRFERIVGVASAGDAAWDGAVPLALSASQAGAVAGLCLAALDGDRRPASSRPILAVSFPAGAVMRIARGDAAMLKSIAADNAAAGHSVLGWLDSQAASALAAHLLAARAAARHLDALDDEVQEIKALLAALPARLATQGDGQLKALVQELSRFMREARDNYASVLSKAAFRERVDEACERAVGLWREGHARLDAARERLAAQARVARFGEVQVEKALGDLREMQEQRRLEELATRVLAGLHVLRIAFGGAAPLTGVNPLQSAGASLQAGADQDGSLVPQLREREQAARGDPYVGRGEFEANRAAMRKLLDALAAAPAAAALSIDRLASAQAAAAEGFPEAGGGDDRWLVRVDAAAGNAEVRRAAVVRLH